MSDRIGMRRSLVGGLVLHVILLVLLSTIAESTFVAIPLLMLWAIFAWSSGPILQYHMVSLAPQASGIMLSLYTSVLQLSIAAAAGIGGLAVGSISVTSVSWIGAVSVAIGAILAGVSFSRHPNRRSVYESN